MSMRDHFPLLTRFASGVSLLLLAAGAAFAQMPRVELAAGIHRINAELAHTDAQRQKGLMFRKSLLPQEGMLFAFDRSERICMWMKNTYLPLSVAFIDESGTIVNIEDMEPHTETSHCATTPVLYALEMNLGWFTKRGLRAGTRISGIGQALSGR